MELFQKEEENSEDDDDDETSVMMTMMLGIGVQVGRMGYVPAYGGNGNSRNLWCSKPSLHCHELPWEEALYKWLQKALLTLCMWRYINEPHLHLHLHDDENSRMTTTTKVEFN